MIFTLITGNPVGLVARQVHKQLCIFLSGNLKMLSSTAATSGERGEKEAERGEKGL
jgi:hypothetical protein